MKAATDLRLSNVAFAERDGSRAASSLGKTLRLKTTVDGSDGDAAFRFVGQNAADIQPLDLQLEEFDGGSRTYTGDVTTPKVPFRVAVTGIDSNGFRYQRVDERLSTR